MSILLAGKCGEDNNSLPDDNLLVDAKNRGGMWKVKSEAFKIFLSEQVIAMVSQLVQYCGIHSNFTKIRNQSSKKLSKEISLNLLEHLIILYIRVCAFSFVKDKRGVQTGNKKEKIELSSYHDQEKLPKYGARALNCHASI